MSERKYQAVLFDLDGVICHTDQYHYQAWKAIADQLGTEFTPEDNNLLRGVSRMESLNILLRKCPREVTQSEREVLAQKKNEIYRELLTGMTPDDLSNEVYNTLLALRRMGIKMCIASSSKNTPLILERLGLDNFFDAVVDGNRITRSKPDPEVFLTAAKAVGLAPERCLVVEDADAGLHAANAGGFDSAAVGSAVHCGKMTYKLDNLKQLVLIIGVKYV